MGARDSGTGIELRKGAISETIRIVFQYQGKRCRESIRLPHTKTNIAYAKRLHSEVVNAIARGEFHYEDYFPNSRTAKALRKPIPVEPTPAAPVTVGDLLKDYLAIAKRNLEVSTFQCYQQVARNHLYPKWADVPAILVTSKDLRTWIMSLTAKRKTIQLILTPMRNAIELGVTEEVLESNPFDSIKLGKLLPREQRISTFKADPFDIDEIEAILAACNRAEDRNMFQFAFCTGMRPSEYVALQWQSVREDRHHIAVEGAFVDGQAKDTAKTPAGLRNIDSRRGALEALRAQHEHTGGQVGLVFVNPVTRRQWNGDKPIYKRWKQIVALSGVRFRNPYQTRHSFASNLLMLGANPLYVASQMGHADTTMVTRTYGKWITAGLDDDRRERLLRLYQQSNPKRQDEFPRFD
jgi:integrase